MHHVDKMRWPQAIVWFVVLLSLSIAISGCQPGTKPSTVELLIEAEAAVSSASDTVELAIQIGRLDPASETAERLVTTLRAAGTALDAAWTAYRAGDMVGADGARRVALDAYWSVRPLLLELE